MSWNYRMIEDSHGGYAIHEVYYDVEGNPHSWSLHASPVYGETLEEVASCLKMMKKALNKNIMYIKGDCIFEAKP
jgi:hypothetical protein